MPATTRQPFPFPTTRAPPLRPGRNATHLHLGQDAARVAAGRRRLLLQPPAADRRGSRLCLALMPPEAADPPRDLRRDPRRGGLGSTRGSRPVPVPEGASPSCDRPPRRAEPDRAYARNSWRAAGRIPPGPASLRSSPARAERARVRRTGLQIRWLGPNSIVYLASASVYFAAARNCPVDTLRRGSRSSRGWAARSPCSRCCRAPISVVGDGGGSGHGVLYNQRRRPRLPVRDLDRDHHHRHDSGPGIVRDVQVAGSGLLRVVGGASPSRPTP